MGSGRVRFWVKPDPLDDDIWTSYTDPIEGRAGFSHQTDSARLIEAQDRPDRSYFGYFKDLDRSAWNHTGSGLGSPLYRATTQFKLNQHASRYNSAIPLPKRRLIRSWPLSNQRWANTILGIRGIWRETGALIRGIANKG